MSNSNENNTSIEVVSEDGPLPINIMMQEGVKALSKILSEHLQDGKTFEEDSHSMQMVFKNVQGVMKEAMDNGSNNDKIVELDSQINLNNMSQDIGDNRSVVVDNEDFASDPELHLDAADGEIIFDYGSEIITDNPEGLGERLSQIIESVIPNGFAKDKGGMLHAVLNGDELNITEGDASRTTYLDTFEDNRNNIQENSNINISTRSNKRQHNNSSSIHSNDHTHSRNQSSNYVKYKNYNYHDYKYYPINEKKQGAPDFSVLLNNDSHLCMFCEYYMVFGEPPKNMIKWYNNVHGYNCVTHPKN